MDIINRYQPDVIQPGSQPLQHTLLPVLMGLVIVFFTAQIWRLFAG